MEKEILEELKEYQLDLENQKIELLKERESFIEKISNGESLSKKENKRNLEITAIIKDIDYQTQEVVDIMMLIEDIDLYDETIKGINKISNKNFTKNNAGDNTLLVANIKENIISFNCIEGLTEKELNEDFLVLTNPNAKNKTKIKNKYINAIKDNKNNVIKELNTKLSNNENLKHLATDIEEIEVLEPEVIEENKDKKEKVKTVLNKKNEEEKKSNYSLKTVIAVAIGTSALTGLIVSMLLGKPNKNNLNSSNTEEDVNNETETIEIYEEDIAQEAYLTEYKEIQDLFNFTEAESINYVNRAKKIEEHNFFQNKETHEIVEILDAINNKNLFTKENASNAQAFNTTFNRVTDNFLFGTPTDDDIDKFNALQYMAKENTDLDHFLTEYAFLNQEILKNPNSSEAKDKMYNFLATYALTLNGFTNKDENINITKPYNENAILDDYYDWYIAQDSFVQPLAPLHFDEKNPNKYSKLQLTMESALTSPEFNEICQQLTLKKGE